MCDICCQSPCNPRCPNAEPTPREWVANCDICGEKIYEGDDVIKLDDYIYHYDCVSDLPFPKLLDLFGIESKEAKPEDFR